MNLLELRTNIRSLLNEEKATFWSDAELNRWINFAQFDLADKLTDDLLIPLTLRVVLGRTEPKQPEYSLPFDFLRIKKVQLDELECIPIAIEKVQALEINPFYEPSDFIRYRVYYYIWNKKIVFYPILWFKKITCWYIKQPSFLTRDSDIPEIPEHLHELLCFYTIYLGKMKDEEFEQATMWKTLYENEIRVRNARYFKIHKIEELPQMELPK